MASTKLQKYSFCTLYRTDDLMNKMNQSFILEITVISAQGLKDTSFSRHFTFLRRRRARPFTTISTTPPPYDSNLVLAATTTSCKKLSKVCKTKADDEGGLNPTWGDKFELPLDATFFNFQSPSCIYLQVYTKRFFVGYIQLGWCQIPAADILDGFLPAGSLRHLAYHLRARDGSRGHGIVNVAAKLGSAIPVDNPQWSTVCSRTAHSLKLNATDQMVMGIPVTVSSIEPQP